MSEELNQGLAIRNIAIATDFAPWSDRAMQHALVIARWYRAAPHIVHTVRRSEFSFVPTSWCSLTNWLHEIARI